MALAPSSPRLPSPPPPAEIQLGPKSPSGGAVASLHTAQMEQTLLAANSRRRIHPGTKAADMAAGPPVVPLDKLDSPFQLQEHLAALHNRATASGTRALTREAAQALANVPEGIDRTLWLYELCRFLISQCNTLIVGFLFDAPPCSANTCPEMRASEWQFLCAVHETPKSCCAIDYCCHTLDWAANVVTDQKIFPSRFMVHNDAQNKNLGLRNLVNVFRRLHRIFAHAWFQHRSVFWAVEGQSGLYVFFKAVCDTYDLLPAENYKLPPEAEGLEAPPAESDAEKQPPPMILERESSEPDQPQQGVPARHHFNFEESNIQPPSRTNTRRHIRASPSTGSAVTTVMETEEEDGDGVTKKMRELQLSAPETVEEEPDSADVPVIVDHTAIIDTPAITTEPALPQAESKGDKPRVNRTVDEAEDSVIEDEKSDPEATETVEGSGADPSAAAETKPEEAVHSEDATSSAASESEAKHEAGTAEDSQEEAQPVTESLKETEEKKAEADV
ncbi:hypothetical protein NLU13_0537 [Sarocladium strictum]|uniref:Mob1 n=1 Tax=Sarocladium strictum TaxID=5046 RepID=A0AA39GP87_SARSR|nr:hypothetical protein NLU13_0537 [Sarocladium strictum]